MKLFIAVISLALAICAEASPAPYAHDVVAYSNPWPLKTSSVWPAYGGLYGGKVAVVPEVAYEKYVYPNVYGNWPVYGKNWGYSSPVVTVGAKVVDNGLWKYGGYGYGNGYGLGYNKYWH
ncbi:AAEL002189-PA [Aedes aegypti]|uniref:AAEL002189-PA n=2 Tax=Aedes aegypti TaxID=7159 RepID=A0A1S4F0Y5_AEDAE|nr:uncharacterized protein LOC5573916 [Aedes aegypti]EAT46612.1 AAEL002189-PA [Aedes aegypti]